MMMQQFKTAILATLVCFVAFTQPISNVFGRTATSPGTTVSCDAPTVTITGQGADSFTFAVQSNSGSLRYKYVNKGTGAESGVLSAGNGTLTVNLPAGTYTFYFWSVCGGEESGVIIIDDLLTW